MKKKNLLYSNTLLVLCFLLGSLSALETHAQYCGNSGPSICTPQGGLSTEGFYPSDTDFPCASDGSAFSNAITFVAPSSVDGYTLSNIAITSITNLPCGLCWASNSSNNQISGGGSGCINLSGLTNEVPGQYNLIVYAQATVTGVPFIGTLTVGPLNIDSAEGLSYYVRVTAPGGACPGIQPTGGTASTPGSIVKPTISGSTSFCPGGNTTLTANGASYYGYIWSNGANTQSITVSAANKYTVSVYDNCASATASVNVTEGGGAATITPGGPTTFCQGGSVTLTANQGASYSWSTGATTQSIVASTNGSYTVTVTSNGGCSGGSSPISVTVNSNPSANVTAGGPTSFCQGGSVTLTVTATAGASYQWSDNTSSTSDVITTSGVYNVTVTGSNSCTAVSTNTTVTVSPPTTATITPGGPTSFCQGGSVTLTASSGTAYIWSNGATTGAITVTTSGSYSVTVTLAGGCQAVSAPTTVTVNSQAATITASGPTSFCAGGSVTLTASTGSTYSWSTGATTQSITVTTAASYVVTVTNVTGCPGVSAPTVVSLSPAPVITASGPTTFPQGGSVTLTVTQGTGYLWSGGSTSESIIVSTCGTYDAIVYFGGGCASAATPVVVTVTAP